MDFTTLEYLLLFAASILAGALNAVAGGGTFFAFPALESTGVSALVANATCKMAIWPGSLASVAGYRKEIDWKTENLKYMAALSLVGGGAGAVLLLYTPERVFEYVVPWLLLIATVLFACGRRFAGWVADLGSGHQRFDRFRFISSSLLQFLIALYGGFFGAGIGILTLAMLQLLGMEHMHKMNAVKKVVTACINAVAFLIFTFSGIVVWNAAAIMIVGAVIGGFYGAKLALKIKQEYVRHFVLLVAIGTTIYFFVKYYG
jgi:uncharacterized membrane protein YfcA